VAQEATGVPIFRSGRRGSWAQRLREEKQPKDTIEQVILRRGSTRAFDKTASITLDNSQLFSIAPRAVFRLTSLSPPARSSTIFT